MFSLIELWICSIESLKMNHLIDLAVLRYRDPVKLLKEKPAFEIISNDII